MSSFKSGIYLEEWENVSCLERCPYSSEVTLYNHCIYIIYIQDVIHVVFMHNCTVSGCLNFLLVPPHTHTHTAVSLLPGAQGHADRLPQTLDELPAGSQVPTQPLLLFQQSLPSSECGSIYTCIWNILLYFELCDGSTHSSGCVVNGAMAAF